MCCCDGISSIMHSACSLPSGGATYACKGVFHLHRRFLALCSLPLFLQAGCMAAALLLQLLCGGCEPGMHSLQLSL